MADHDEQLFQRDLRNFKQNPAWNLSAYLVIGAPTLYMRVLFSAAQKECVHVAHLLATSDDNFNLPVNLMVPLLFPGMFMADVLSGVYFVFEAHFLMRSAYLHVGKMLLRQRGVDFRPSLTLQPDFALRSVDRFSRANLGFYAAEVYTSWLLSGAVGRCSVDSGL